MNLVRYFSVKIKKPSLNGFNKFLQLNSDKYRDLKLGERSKLLANDYKQLTDDKKEELNKLIKIEQENYQKLQVYLDSHNESKLIEIAQSHGLPPKLPKSSYSLFISDNSRGFLFKNLKEAAEKWKSMTPTELENYNNKYREVKKEYNKKLAEFKMKNDLPKDINNPDVLAIYFCEKNNLN